MAHRGLRDGVAEEIRVLLVRRRLSATVLARQIGVTQSYLARRMAATQPFTLDDLERIAKALGVRVVDLFPQAAREPESDPIGRYHSGAVSRPSDRRPPSRPASHRPPSGPGRTSRVQRPIAA